MFLLYYNKFHAFSQISKASPHPCEKPMKNAYILLTFSYLLLLKNDLKADILLFYII